MAADPLRSAGETPPPRRSALEKALTVGAAAAFAAGAGGYRFNTSPSLPRGLYRLTLPARPLRPGDLILACPPAAIATLALARGYLPAGRCPGGVEPLGKLVLAAAGDLVDLAPTGLRLDGRPLPGTASLSADSRRRPVPRYPPGRYRVPPGEIWLISPHPRSFDSRYFGPVPAAGVLGRLTPLLTATGADPGPLAALLRRATRTKPWTAPPRTSRSTASPTTATPTPRASGFSLSPPCSSTSPPPGCSPPPSSPAAGTTCRRWAAPGSSSGPTPSPASSP